MLERHDVAPLLYLDTARLGQMSPSAQRAQQDFARLAGEVGGAIQIEDFLVHGVEACDPRLRRNLPGLETWKGIESLKESIRRLAGIRDQLPLLLAARSAELMKLAALLLCGPCRNILVTDLGWPPYHRILQSQCGRAHRKMTIVPVADDALHGRICAAEAAERIRRAYAEHQCDGLFLTAVSNTGVRLPIETITRSVSDSCRFVVVDGAQDFCHVADGAPHDCCDLYLTGCHKWLGGYHPLGIACYGRRRSRKYIETTLSDALDAMQVDDPLLRIVERLGGTSCCDSGETVNLTALFSSCGATRDAEENCVLGSSLHGRLENVERVTEIAAAVGWIPRVPDHSMRSGIAMLQNALIDACNLTADAIRRKFQRYGVAATAYDGGLVRLSMPTEPLRPSELELLTNALTNISRL